MAEVLEQFPDGALVVHLTAEERRAIDWALSYGNAPAALERAEREALGVMRYGARWETSEA